MSSAANRNTRYCACTKYRVFLLADRANARTSRKPKVFEDALRKKALRICECERDRANARTSRKPKVFEDALRKKAQRICTADL